MQKRKDGKQSLKLFYQEINKIKITKNKHFKQLKKNFYSGNFFFFSKKMYIFVKIFFSFFFSFLSKSNKNKPNQIKSNQQIIYKNKIKKLNVLHDLRILKRQTGHRRARPPSTNSFVAASSERDSSDLRRQAARRASEDH